jgi:hypothetical protein
MQKNIGQKVLICSIDVTVAFDSSKVAVWVQIPNTILDLEKKYATTNMC